MRSPQRSTRFAIAIPLAAIATLAPLSLSPKSGASVNEACADGACCMEFDSFCGTLIDHYTSLSGRCGIRTLKSESDKAQAERT